MIFIGKIGTKCADSLADILKFVGLLLIHPKAPSPMIATQYTSLS
jgi:hypothetical protein